ncbi:hypothetical protein IW138_004531 [Coemansia sp. RSA 986]|nr:hypothetical protein IW138_004531 [Coemansia sp. RSA 986]
MQANSPTIYRQQQQHQRLASINDYQLKHKPAHQSPVVTNGHVNGANTALVPKPAETQQQQQQQQQHQKQQKRHLPFINEEFMTYLLGGPFNRFALALKSNLENEIDWACARLVPATSYAPDTWSLAHHAPFLVEAILGVLEKSRKVLTNASFQPNKATKTAGLLRGGVRRITLTDTGLEMLVERSAERAELLSTALFNIAQIGENAGVMAQDPRITIEATHWLRSFHGDGSGFARVKTDLLDLLDILLPLTPQPPFDSAPLRRRWPVFGSQESSALDPLALVETCLWAELVRVLYESQERKLVLGALRVLVQSVSWHPQLAREILDLPVPKWAYGSSHDEYVGELINGRLAELLLAPDPELVSGCLELLLNTVRLETMAKSLDEELETFAHKAAEAAAARGGISSVANIIGEKQRRKRLRSGYNTPDIVAAALSGAESGSQTPIFGFRSASRSSGAYATNGEAQHTSEATMLPDGLAALVALVMQQWMSAACPPPAPYQPMTPSGSSSQGQKGGGDGMANGTHNSQQKNDQQQQEQSASKQPTEPELREACTWVLLNYEFIAPMPNQQQQQQQTPSYVTLTDLFGRYMIAKHGQTVPRIGRALTLAEMVRVVAAVFPKASIQSVASNQQRQVASEHLLALHLRSKTQHIIPIPAVPVDNQQKQQQQQQSLDTEAPSLSPAISSTNMCCWHGCSEKLTSEAQALEHVSQHIGSADACRWRSCNRIPASVSDGSAGADETRRWLQRHVLIHGPFYKDEEDGKPKEEQSSLDNKSSAAATTISDPDMVRLAKQIREEKTGVLSCILPLFSGGTVPQSDQKAQQQVMRLVLQGVGLIEQLQKWADRRAGSRGLQDRIRIWRCADEVLERVAYVAAQNTVVAPYASRLLAIISQPSSSTSALTAGSKKRSAAVPANSVVTKEEKNDSVEYASSKPAKKDQEDGQGSDADDDAAGIEALAKKYWLNDHPKWSEAAVANILDKHIIGSKYARSTLQALERLQYFELCLWPHYKPSSMTDATLISILMMLNEKHTQGLSRAVWTFISEGSKDKGATFANLFDDVVAFSMKAMETGEDPVVRSLVAQFLVACFSSLETPTVRDACMPLTSLLLWHHIDDSRRLVDAMFERTPQLQRLWKHLSKKCTAGKKTTAEEAGRNQRDRDYLPSLIRDFVNCVLIEDNNEGMLAYCVKFLELLIDLESQLPTRRYVNLLLVDYQVVSLCEQASWYSKTRNSDTKDDIFTQLVDQLRDKVYFQVRDVTGEAVSEEEAREMHYQLVQDLQLVAFKEFTDTLEPLALSSVARLGDDPSMLISILKPLGYEELLKLAHLVGIRTKSIVTADTGIATDGRYTKPYIIECFVQRYMRRTTVAAQVRAISLYPTEEELLNRLVVETDQCSRLPYSVSYKDRSRNECVCIRYPVLPVPKLNLQFLSNHDYLMRCFELFRLESTYEIRENVVDAVRRLQPRPTYDESVDVTMGGGGGGESSLDAASNGNTHFDGWARMAVPMASFSIVDVQRPKIGERAPSQVRADISIDLGVFTESIRREWLAEVRPRDVLILLAVRATAGNGSLAKDNDVLRCIQSVRGCEVVCRLDSKGKPVDEQQQQADGENINNGWILNLRVSMDTHQYHEDTSRNNEDIYVSLNVAMRRRPQENNFKAVLETIRDLMMTMGPSAAVLPNWLAPTFLGYGDPTKATAWQQARIKAESSRNKSVRLNLGDTFLNEEHLRECLEGATIKINGAFAKPCIVEFPVDPDGAVYVSSEPPADVGPIELRRPRENQIRFTAAQASAIQSACLPGLSLIVGPPGTGKTDVAVQIIANLYHAYPAQKILLVTHSNQALNQLFEKIIALNIEPRHLLRLGHGEEELDAEERYSKAGRVESFLERRLELLAEVRQLAESLGARDDYGYTCDTARLFFITHVKLRWEPYYRKASAQISASSASAAQCVVDEFPFAQFFESVLGHSVFTTETSAASDLLDTALGCFRYIEQTFDELADIQPFELLRSSNDRSNYLLTNQARIVAMTCTHAALKRKELAALGFQYDTVVMEEAAQILDVETFVPLVLQRPSKNNRLKRLVMIGDHNQLPPVVKNTGLRAFANMEQSMFTRLVRLGVPYTELNRQARARPEIASLFRYRYTALGDLEPLVTTGRFALANSGFKNAFQFIDVADFNSRGGESAPTRYFYQNLGEAEYVVAVYQYMRLLGYPAASIAILTTYNGQRALLRDVLQRRCMGNDTLSELFGLPGALSTVDQYQGQQSDYVLLSLVRTKSVGHLRDLRRLTVALSRARLGLYVFGRRQLFETCFELQRPMKLLLANGDRLVLNPAERFGQEQERADDNKCAVIQGVEEMGTLVYQMIEEAATENDQSLQNDSGPE